jgi:TfoX/Sxy family transcriptional regulator of competence genes
MATSQGTIDYLHEQLVHLGDVTTRKMFGEYALYLEGKVVAFICDDQLFLKPTNEGRALLDEVIEGQAYPGSKPYLVIPGDQWEDPDKLGTLIRTTADALPAAAPKKPRKARKPKTTN